MISSWRWSLVGRDHQLAAIHSAHDEGGSVVVIDGAAGVGKSRLAREVLAAAAADGAAIAWVQGTRSGATVALGAFASLIPADDRSDDLFRLLQRALRIELNSLDERATSELAEAILDGPVDRCTQRWIWQTSRGNALYVRELLLGARSGGALRRAHGLWTVPAPPPMTASLTELVAARLADLSPAEQTAADLLAVGEPVRLSEMTALVGDEALLATEARGLVEIAEAPGGSEQVRLAHPLFGEVIRESMPTLRSRAVRRLLVATARARKNPEPGDTVRLVRWMLEAGETPDSGLLLDAAPAANQAGDPDFGAELATRGLAAGGVCAQRCCSLGPTSSGAASRTPRSSFVASRPSRTAPRTPPNTSSGRARCCTGGWPAPRTSTSYSNVRAAGGPTKHGRPGWTPFGCAWRRSSASAKKMPRRAERPTRPPASTGSPRRSERWRWREASTPAGSRKPRSSRSEPGHPCR